MESRTQSRSLQAYAELVQKGYSHYGPNLKDVEAIGGIEKARGYLHQKAAYELMEADPSLTERQARELVTKIVEDLINFPPED